MSDLELSPAELANCDIDPHAISGMTYASANRHLSLVNLKAKFPTAPEPLWDSLQAAELEDYTMSRVFAHMLKLDNQFTLYPSDDLELLHACIAEAGPFKEWVENVDEDAPRPEFMAWKEGMPSYSMIPSDSSNDDEFPRVVKQPRTTAPTGDSPRKRAMAIYTDHIARGIPKADTIKEYIEVLKLQPATAQVYYSNAKTAAKRA